MRSLTTNPATGSKYSLIALASIIGITVLLCLYQRFDLGFRAGHMDEYDYLFVGRTLLNNLHWPTYTYIFGANSSWYLFGLGEQWLGGLTGARAVSAAVGLISLAAVYSLSHALWQCKKTAVCSTLLVAVSASHVFISKIATYDSVGFMFFTLSLTPLLYSSGMSRTPLKTSTKTFYLCIGSALLLAAVLTKYTNLVYIPLIGIALLCVSIRTAIIFGILTGAGLALYTSLHWQDLLVLYKVQISGTHSANATYQEIISRTLNSTWLLLLPAITALFYARSNRDANKQTTTIVMWLLVLSTPLFIYHLQSRNLISLYKHLTYTNLFLALPTAWLLVRIAKTTKNEPIQRATLKTYVFSVLAIAYVSVNFIQVQTMQRAYPDVSELMRHLQTTDTPVSSILSEDPYLFRYLKFAQMEQQHIKETTWLDNNSDGVHSFQDVKDAAWDRKFELILLTDAIHPEQNPELREILTQRGYVLEFSENYELSSVMTTNVSGQLGLYRLSESVATAGQLDN